MNQFAQLVKTLEREATELKTVRRIATSTLETQTKSINASGVITRQQGKAIYTRRAAFIGINTPDCAPFSATLSNEEQRLYRIFGASKDGRPGIIVAPTYTRNLDVNMAMGDKTINFTVNVTSSDAITLTFEQVDFEA